MIELAAMDAEYTYPIGRRNAECWACLGADDVWQAREARGSQDSRVPIRNMLFSIVLAKYSSTKLAEY